MPHIINDEMFPDVSFALSCYLDDLQKEIKRTEKLSGRQDKARAPATVSID